MRAPASMSLATSLSSHPSFAGLVAGVTFASLAMCACSGASTSSFPDPDLPEAAPPLAETNGEAGSFFDGSLVQEAATALCDPQSVAGFEPAWTPPETWKQKVCTGAQISAFYAACLTPPISKAACQAFVSESGACAACLQSEDTAPTASAVVWHQHDAYWTVNVAGCIAEALSDPSGTGCGASYAAAIACRQASCNACWEGQGTTTTFAEFSTCEEQAGQSTCLTYATAVPDVCGDLSQGPGSACMPAAGATAEDAFMQIAPLFCGP